MNEMRKLMEALEEAEQSVPLPLLADRLEKAYEDFYFAARKENPEWTEKMNSAASEVFYQLNKIMEYR